MPPFDGWTARREAGGVAGKKARSKAAPDAPKSLTLTETGIGTVDGKDVVNIDAIIKALDFLTEGRSRANLAQMKLGILAFQVIEAIILGGPRAKAFAGVKAKLTDKGDKHRAVMTAIERAAFPPKSLLVPPDRLDLPAAQLRAALAAVLDATDLDGVNLDVLPLSGFEDAVKAFRALPRKNWPKATAHLLVQCQILGHWHDGDEKRPIADVVEQARKNITGSFRESTKRAKRRLKRK